jgi:hypothetical protein
MDDDPLEAAEEASPQLPLRSCSAREEVMRGEDERGPLAQQPVVDLWRRQPLDVGNVGVPPAETGKPERMLEELDRDPQPRAPKDPRAEWIEELAARVAVRLGRLAEAERRGDEVDVCACPRERRGELVVVRHGEARRIEERHPHA